MTEPAPAVVVRHLRQSLLWPLRLIHDDADAGAGRREAPWRALRDLGEASPWREHVDEYHGSGFHERHYNEFVAFLPYVQRFLYGEGRSQHAGDVAQGSPMRVFRRRDLAALRVGLRPGEAPLQLRVEHVDLYFFYGVDIVLLNVEVSADDLPLPQAREVMLQQSALHYVDKAHAFKAGLKPIAIEH